MEVAIKLEEGLHEPIMEDLSDVVEVFVGGLAPDVSDQAVLKAFTRDSLVPRALHVSRHPRTQKCKGFGFVQFGDQASAHAACGLISEVDGRLVGVHLSRGGNVDDVALGQMTPIQDEAGGTTGVSIHQLLQLVRMQPNRPECITSANNIARAQPVRARKRKADGLVEAEEVVDSDKFIESNLPRTRQMLAGFHANPATSKKTPLAILHEYASKRSLQLTYQEQDKGDADFFLAEANLTSGKSKKDAKQTAAASALEMLLENVPEADFQLPGRGALQLKPAGGRGRGAQMPSSGRGNGSAPSPGIGTVVMPTAGGGRRGPPATGNGSVGTPTSASVSGATRKLGRGSGSAPAPAAARSSGGATSPVRSSVGTLSAGRGVEATPSAGRGATKPHTGHGGAAMPSTGRGSGNPNTSRNSMPTGSTGRGSMSTPNNKRGRDGSMVPVPRVRQPGPRPVWRPPQQLQYTSPPQPAPPLRQPAPPPQRQQQTGMAVGMYSTHGGQQGSPFLQAPMFMQAPPQGQQPMLAAQSSSGALQGQYVQNAMAGRVAGQMAGGPLNQVVGAPVQQAQPLPLQQPLMMHQGLLQQQAQMMNQHQTQMNQHHTQMNQHQTQLNQTFGSMGPARVPNSMQSGNPQISMQPY
eukprot:jgi/Astpho2/7855/Aster-x1463